MVNQMAEKDSKHNIGDTIAGVLSLAIALICIYLSVIAVFVIYDSAVLIHKFVMLVIFGNVRASDFIWSFHSITEANNFFARIIEWLQAVMYRLQH